MKLLRVWFAIILMVTGLCGCASGSATPLLPTATYTPPPTETSAPTATNTLAPTATQTPEPTKTFTPVPPTATITPIPEILPSAGIWRAEGVGIKWLMKFEITIDNGQAYFRLLSAPIIQCKKTKIHEIPWETGVAIVDGKLQGFDFWSIQVISTDRIEGTRNYLSRGTFKWVGTIDKPAIQSPTAAP